MPSKPLSPSASSTLTPPRGFPVAATAAPDIKDPRQTRYLLIVDEDPTVRHAATEVATSLGFTTFAADSLAAVRSVFARVSVDILLLDLRLPGNTSQILLKETRRNFPKTLIVAMNSHATVDSAVEIMRDGVSDYLTKPFGITELTNLLERSDIRHNLNMESRKLRDRLQNSSGIGPLMGDDLAIAKAVRTLSKVATTAHPVLVLGESGTGKELVARSIHSNGPNATKPFIPVDCVSLAPNGIESELFGHTRGAFSGAQQSKEGILSAAGDGTVFFNEIGELPLDLQAKLFRALVERQIRPVGASHTIPISARIVAASNRDLFGMVANGRFRKDLYFRLNVYNIRIPALRDRKADIPLVANHFLKRINHEQKTANTFTDDAIQLMMHYPWPENVTELEKAVERACACSSGPFLTAADFPSPLQDHWRNCVQEAAQESARIRQFQPLPDITPLADIEKKTILDAIRKSRGDKLLAARLLQIGKTTLYRKLKEYDTTNN